MEPHTSFGTQFGTSEFCRLILPQHVPKTKKKSNLQDFRSTTNVAATSSSKFCFCFCFEGVINKLLAQEPSEEESARNKKSNQKAGCEHHISCKLGGQTVGVMGISGYRRPAPLAGSQTRTRHPKAAARMARTSSAGCCCAELGSCGRVREGS